MCYVLKSIYLFVITEIRILIFYLYFYVKEKLIYNQCPTTNATIRHADNPAF